MLYVLPMTKNMYHCTICNEDYIGLPLGGYCDNSLECALDEGDSLVVYP
jgi:hypothetical protein